MAGIGAPLGNNYALKSKPWRDSLERALIQEDGKRLRAAAEKLLDLAAAGEAWAVQELANRMDGKPHQSISGPDGGAIVVSGDVNFVRPPGT